MSIEVNQNHDTYCSINVVKSTRGFSGGGRWLHYVPAVGEYLMLNSGWYFITGRYSICTDDNGNHCELVLSESDFPMNTSYKGF